MWSWHLPARETQLDGWGRRVLGGGQGWRCGALCRATRESRWVARFDRPDALVLRRGAGWGGGRAALIVASRAPPTRDLPPVFISVSVCLTKL